MSERSVDPRILSLIHKGLRRQHTTEDDMIYALSFDHDSLESKLMISTWDRFMRSCCDDTCEIGIQIGIITGPCPGGCAFCNFNGATSDSEYYVMDQDVLKGYVRDAMEFGDVCNISLLTIQDADIDDILESVRTVKSSVPKGVRITINTGDISYEDCVELKKAGVVGAYHALRLREGVDNNLDPEVRKRTWRNLMNAGIVVSCGTEPIGPEHTVEEIVANYMEGIKGGCLNGGTGMRVPVKGTIKGDIPAIPMGRMKQISAVLSLLSTWYNFNSFLNRWDFGFASGGNKIYAEYAGNPRDTVKNSESGVGHTLGWCRRTMYADSYKHVLKSDGSIVDLDLDYLERTGSI